MEVNRHSNPECPETRKSLQGGEGDRRTRRRRQLLTEALTALIREKRYSRITVREIADRAGVGRSTFYAHFKDKEDLFLSGWQGLLDHFVQSIQWERLGRGRFAPVRELFEHVREFYDFYLGLARSRQTDRLFKSGLEHLTQRVEPHLNEHLGGATNGSVPVLVLTNFLSSQLLALLKWWLDQRMPYPPAAYGRDFSSARDTRPAICNGQPRSRPAVPARHSATPPRR